MENFFSQANNFINENPELNNFEITDFNLRIFERISQYSKNQDALITSLIQNPFGENKDLLKAKKAFGEVVYRNLKTLNKLLNFEENKELLEENPLSILIFILNIKTIFANRKSNDKAKKSANKKRAKQGLEILKYIYASKIRDKLEDELFSYLDPETYKKYSSVLKISKANYKDKEKEIIKHCKKFLKEAHIKGETSNRTKSIYSIHNKIKKKNILLSQVLDMIGIRFILENKNDCYKLMALISSRNHTLTNKIKDYITIPKKNNYQSIHLTIIYDGIPVEIQIRTKEMHRFAEYGEASHFEYKNK
jgi:GTP pyrophosphokinase